MIELALQSSGLLNAVANEALCDEGSAGDGPREPVRDSSGTVSGAQRRTPLADRRGYTNGRSMVETLSRRPTQHQGRMTLAWKGTMRLRADNRESQASQRVAHFMKALARHGKKLDRLVVLFGSDRYYERSTHAPPSANPFHRSNNSRSYRSSATVQQHGQDVAHAPYPGGAGGEVDADGCVEEEEEVAFDMKGQGHVCTMGVFSGVWPHPVVRTSPT
ncbi:hypothetical protein BU26DRAFT_228603 [Trematosphaeria pertusa]|uniref:Uncharacterized protein n=1 Tax=Trematosphaeria pertusa TaxID=390896 RepID=A0A6A6IUB4_9PLEO|nr:uncharacterized protein BU26DRAFT_228603 [Trematosphaeria pertusa]KAF2253707.1 hypothetical protein BU26DRAFT_228603 [Trematosphaeria pertusa]